MTSLPSIYPARIALVGDRSDSVQAHAKIPDLIDALNLAGDTAIECYWVRSCTVEGPDDLAGFDGVWVVPGSPYACRDGVFAAIHAARTRGVPFLGTCGGFQHMLLEYARSVCGLPEAEHAEQHPEAARQLIVPLDCSLLGEEAEVMIAPGTVAAEAMGPGVSTERFFCRYGLSRDFVANLVDGGLVMSGHDDRGDVRVAELPGHPFFVGSLFQPELSSDRSWVHPLITAFASAVRRRALAAEAVG
jgi:CTP synthase (UTP-ammonia lyase)